jgi:hypothetical protein
VAPERNPFAAARDVEEDDGWPYPLQRGVTDPVAPLEDRPYVQPPTAEPGNEGTGGTLL